MAVDFNSLGILSWDVGVEAHVCRDEGAVVEVVVEIDTLGPSHLRKMHLPGHGRHLNDDTRSIEFQLDNKTVATLVILQAGSLP